MICLPRNSIEIYYYGISGAFYENESNKIGRDMAVAMRRKID